MFVAVDLFVLFFFYELAIFPMYFLIAIWGWVKTREYAAMKLTLYILIGSVVALVGACWRCTSTAGPRPRAFTASISCDLQCGGAEADAVR